MRFIFFIFYIVKKLKVLETHLGQRVFTGFYFFYKKNIEDNADYFLNKYGANLASGNIIDVGANIGYSSILFQKHLQKPYNVIAFEPEPWNLMVLKKNIKQISSDNIKPYQLAVGKQRQSVELIINDFHHGDHRINVKKHRENHIKVQQIDFDSFYNEFFPGQPISLIKIDVQGYEMSVLNGMLQNISINPKLFLILEFDHEALIKQEVDPSNFFEFLRKLDKKIYILTKRKLIYCQTYNEIEMIKRNLHLMYVDLLLAPIDFQIE